jgi:adenine/guanine phosphoribosyltransferase-like PRPP-binding protein
MSENLTTKEVTQEKRFQAVMDIEKPLEILLNKLKPRFEKTEYAAIVGDDTSGRIPTLAVRRFANKICQERRGSNLPTFFIKGEKMEKMMDSKSVDGLMEVLKASNPENKKVLVVTDLVRTGWTIQSIGEVLEEAGIKFDVASLYTMHLKENFRPKNIYGYPKVPSGTKIFIGEFYVGEPVFYGPEYKKHISGLDAVGESKEKKYPRKVVAVREPEEAQTAKLAREKTNEIVDRISEHLKLGNRRKIFRRPTGK